MTHNGMAPFKKLCIYLFKERNSSDFGIKTPFMRKSRADLSQALLAIIRCRIFYLPVCYPKNIKIKRYRTVILSVILYGFEAWSFTFSDEYRLRLFENRVLRRICGPKRDEVSREWRKLHHE